MERRESMTTQAGQDWVDGNLDPEEYFRAAREKARREAQLVITERLNAAQVAPTPQLQHARSGSGAEGRGESGAQDR